MSKDSVNETINSLLEIVEGLGSRIDICDQELESIHVEWQRDRGRDIGLEAQSQALLSMMIEIGTRLGLPEGRVEACFRQRFLYFQDKAFQQTEAASPGLAAHIDTRVSGEIPTDRGFDPLFPD